MKSLYDPYITLINKPSCTKHYKKSSFNDFGTTMDCQLEWQNIKIKQKHLSIYSLFNSLLLHATENVVLSKCIKFVNNPLYRDGDDPELTNF